MKSIALLIAISLLVWTPVQAGDVLYVGIYVRNGVGYFTELHPTIEAAAIAAAMAQFGLSEPPWTKIEITPRTGRLYEVRLHLGPWVDSIYVFRK